ncbi:MAG: radical SAM protein [Candidatus Bathyarchaeota archaeon]|nr:radical SAM protein [Candidatus Bathyarchaeum tardum]
MMFSCVPRIISWNTTFRCNLKCSHCYVDANKENSFNELNTEQGKVLIDQISELSKPILVLSGGEPLLRDDIFELANYGTKKGLIVTMGTNGTLITDDVAKQLVHSGVRTVAVSVDSDSPKFHDQFRGVKGAWQKTMEGIKACLRNGLNVQFNVTVAQQNFENLENIFSMAESYGVKNAHLFFLVSTGRGKNIKDVTPEIYEGVLNYVFQWNSVHQLNVKPTCAPQFMRIAKQMNIKNLRYSRGCIAGISYCRITPDGSVTPCPYLPVSVGNVKDAAFNYIWYGSEILKALRNYEHHLNGKCGKCEYRIICGGCRARAAGLYDNTLTVKQQSNKFNTLKQSLFAEDPWCSYNPKR